MRIKTFNTCPHCGEELEELEWIVVCQKCKVYFTLKEYDLSPLDAIFVKRDLKNRCARNKNVKKNR